MGISSINTNIAAQYAQRNISVASDAASSSVSRLSSGNRIVRASDDVAGLTIGTSLQSQVSALNTALVNASQATSLLQVADGALAQIQTILQQQKSIALQAGSGSLTDTDRGFLNQQFQALSEQINNLTATTTFNSVGLLDGSLSQNVRVASDTSISDGATASLAFTAIAAGGTVIFGTGAGAVTFAATAAIGTAAATNAQFVLGASVEASVANLAAALNSVNDSSLTDAFTVAQKQTISGFKFEAQGANLVITAKAGGDLSKLVLDTAAAGNGDTTATSNVVGTQRISTATTDVASIDADATAGALANEFTAGVLTYDGTTVATVATGDSLRDIMTKINGNTVNTGISAYITGTAGAYALTLSNTNVAATGTIAGAGLGQATAAAATVTNTIGYSQLGDNNDGLGYGSVVGQGSTGGSTGVLTDQTQLAAKSVISFPDIASGDLLTSTNFGGTTKTITIAGVAFSFTTTAQESTSANEIGVGSTLTETLDNAVEKINSYFGLSTVNYQLDQIEARREGNSIVIASKIAGDATDLATAGTTVAVSGPTGTSASQANLKNTDNGGVDTRGITNENFIGTDIFSNFTSTYVSANKVNLSVEVGGRTYSAQNISTNPTSTGQEVRLISAEGDYFDLTLRSGGGNVVNNQADANLYGQRLDTAVSGVTFYQNRSVASYSATGDLLGTSLKLQSDDFTNLTLSNVSVTAPAGSSTNGNISFSVINGDGSTETYTAQVPLGSKLGAYSVTRFVSESDANKVITFRNGATALDFSTASNASALQSTLRDALGVGSGSGALNFQVGTTASSNVKVSLQSASTDNIFGGQTLSVATASDAANAASVLDSAIATVTAIRANVGALQTQFNFASASLQSSVQNQDAARSQFLDTDIAAESKSYATSQVKLQAGISVLAQANQQLQALLKLIG